MPSYTQMDDERAGQKAKIKAIAEAQAMDIAAGQIRDADLQKRQVLEEQRRQNENANIAYQQGAQEGINAGLGMNQESAQGMINQRTQLREASNQDAAMQIMQEVETAKANGAPPAQIKQMVDAIPDEIKGMIQQIAVARGQGGGQQAPVSAQPQAQQQPASRPTSPANASANAILLQNGELLNKF